MEQSIFTYQWDSFWRYTRDCNKLKEYQVVMRITQRATV